MPDPWKEQGERNGWTMPETAWWRRLPVIRHLRAMRHLWRIQLWHSLGPGSNGIPTGYDEWVVYGIFHGKERPQ